MRCSRFNSVLLAIFIAVTRNAVASPPDAAGPPQLVMSPFAALQRVAGMAGQAKTSLMSPREFALFSDIENGRAASWTTADVALLASGVNKEEDRQYYLSQLDEIANEAREATANAETPEQKAKLLSKVLVKRLSKGVDDQNDLRKLLDDGVFNCVTSSIFFDIIARPMGLKTHAVLIPNHIFLRMGDLDIDLCKVSSTADHDAGAVTRIWNKANPTVKSAFGSSRTYESGDMSLVGQIYHNQCSLSANEKHYGKAVACELKALCLDPRNPLFRRILELHLKNWFTSCIQQNRLDRARTLAEISGQIFGHQPITSQLYRELANAMPSRTARQVASAR
jgi:hypothetical protein